MSGVDPALYAQALAELRAVPMRPSAAPEPEPEPVKPRRKPGPVPGAPSRVECGTYSGYVHHKKRGEDACEDCLEAKREYYRAYYAANATRIRAQRRKGGSR